MNMIQISAAEESRVVPLPLAHENMHVVCFHVKMKAPKHACFHVNISPGAYFYPPLHHNGKGSIVPH
jgi:hypothetical protein